MLYLEREMKKHCLVTIESSNATRPHGGMGSNPVLGFVVDLFTFSLILFGFTKPKFPIPKFVKRENVIDLLSDFSLFLFLDSNTNKIQNTDAKILMGITE